MTEKIAPRFISPTFNTDGHSNFADIPGIDNTVSDGVEKSDTQWYSLGVNLFTILLISVLILIVIVAAYFVLKITATDGSKNETADQSSDPPDKQQNMQGGAPQQNVHTQQNVQQQNGQQQNDFPATQQYVQHYVQQYIASLPQNAQNVITQPVQTRNPQQITEQITEQNNEQNTQQKTVKQYLPNAESLLETIAKTNNVLQKNISSPKTTDSSKTTDSLKQENENSHTSDESEVGTNTSSSK